MQNDETIWECINNGWCSFKVKCKSPPQTFCRNIYNVTGLCNKASCPLANGHYGTVLENDGKLYLTLKTVERAHTPKNMWEKIELPKNFTDALEMIKKEMTYIYPEHMINKCKSRLTKLRQMLIRERRLSTKVQMKLVPVKKKTVRRELSRELKAESAAKIETSIEKELLERLRSNVYGDIYNFDTKQFNQMLDEHEEMEEEDEEMEEEGLEEEMEGEEEEKNVYLVDDIKNDESSSSGSSSGEEEDDNYQEIYDDINKLRRKRRKIPRIEVEYEMENENIKQLAT